MLEMDWKKDMQANYLVVKGELEIDNYRVKMLLNNNIEGLLKMEIRVVDDECLYYYDVTQKQAFHKIAIRGQLHKEQIVNLITSIIQIMKEGREYLLEEDNYVLDPNYMFISMSYASITLCYVEGYQQPIGKQLCELVEYLMGKVNHQEEEAVILIYALYRVSREEGCTFEDLMEIMESLAGNKMERKGKADIMDMPPFMEKEGIAIEGSVEKEFRPKAKNRRGVVIGSGVLLLILAIIVLPTRYFRYEFSGKLNYTKAMLFVMILVCVQVYMIRKIRPIKCDKVEKEEGILREVEVPEDGVMEEEAKTMVLGERIHAPYYRLHPKDLDMYQDINLIEFPFFIGKLATKMNSVIDNKMVSRFHAKIEQEEDSFYITDLNSTNGTFVNKEKIQAYERQPLQLNDEISFADVQYNFTFC